MQYNEYYTLILSALLLLATVGWGLTVRQLINTNPKSLDVFLGFMLLVFSILILGQALALKKMTRTANERPASRFEHVRY